MVFTLARLFFFFFFGENNINNKNNKNSGVELHKKISNIFTKNILQKFECTAMPAILDRFKVYKYKKKKKTTKKAATKIY